MKCVKNSELGVPQKLLPVFEELLQASNYALDTSNSVWDFAVSIRSLFKLGATETDLRKKRALLKDLVYRYLSD